MSSNCLAKFVGQGILASLSLGVWLAAGGGGEKSSPVQVTIRDDKPVVVEPVLPIDSTQRIQYSPGGISVSIRDENNRTLHLSHFPTFRIDDQIYQQGQGGRFETANQALPKGPTGSGRRGFQSVYILGDFRIHFTAELTATKPPKGGDKRRMDAVLIRYQVENKGNQTRKFGLRIYMDAYCIDNDGAQFAAPTMPGKVLNGVELKGKTMPDYVQKLQRPDLKNPGFVAHLTFNLGGGLEKPSRVVLTQHGAGFNTWDMPAQAAGDTGLGFFWEPKEIKPGGKRGMAYAYGQGLAIGLAHEGDMLVNLGGSFEPGKLFTVSALVNDPAPGQALTLELPPGMERIEGKETQPVVLPPEGDVPQSLVVWKARVHKLGEFPIRVRSNTGVTQTKVVTIRANDAKTN